MILKLGILKYVFFFSTLKITASGFLCTQAYKVTLEYVIEPFDKEGGVHTTGPGLGKNNITQFGLTNKSIHWNTFME